MRKLIGGIVVFLLLSIVCATGANNSDPKESVVKISSTLHGSEVEFNMAILSSVRDLELKKMSTPIELDISNIDIAGYLLEKVSGDGVLHVEIQNESNRVAGSGNSLIVTTRWKQSAISVIK